MSDRPKTVEFYLLHFTSDQYYLELIVGKTHSVFVILSETKDLLLLKLEILRGTYAEHQRSAQNDTVEFAHYKLKRIF